MFEILGYDGYLVFVIKGTHICERIRREVAENRLRKIYKLIRDEFFQAIGKRFGIVTEVGIRNTYFKLVNTKVKEKDRDRMDMFVLQAPRAVLSGGGTSIIYSDMITLKRV